MNGSLSRYGALMLVVRRSLWIFLAAFVLFLVGCPGPTFVVQQYSGAQRAPETIATLRVNGNEPVRLLVLDHQDAAAPIVEDGRLHIEMLPGRHQLIVGDARASGARHLPVTFQAEAGRFYRVVFVQEAGGEPRVYEVSREKDALTRDVTLPPDAGTEHVPPARKPEPPPPVEDAGAPHEPASPTSEADAG